MMYVDTNYWIYWFDQRLPEHTRVVETVREAVRDGVILNMVTVMEIAHYFRHLPNQHLQDRMESILNLATLTLVDLNLDVMKLALDLLTKHARTGIDARDSVILATMKRNNVKRIATHDTAFKRIRGVEVVDDLAKDHKSRMRR